MLRRGEDKEVFNKVQTDKVGGMLVQRSGVGQVVNGPTRTIIMLLSGMQLFEVAAVADSVQAVVVWVPVHLGRTQGCSSPRARNTTP